MFFQVIPLHLPPGDTSTERTLKIEGTSEQIESAKQLADSILSGEVCFVPYALTCHVPSLVLLRSFILVRTL